MRFTVVVSGREEARSTVSGEKQMITPGTTHGDDNEPPKHLALKVREVEFCEFLEPMELKA